MVDIYAAVRLLAQQPDPTPGWFSVVIQGGSFGLLGYLLVYGLPRLYVKLSEDRARDQAQFTATLEQQRKAFIDELREKRADYSAGLKSLTDTFREESHEERAACERHFGTLAEAMSKGNEVTVSTVRTIMQQVQEHSARNQQWLEVLRAELSKVGKAEK